MQVHALKLPAVRRGPVSNVLGVDGAVLTRLDLFGGQLQVGGSLTAMRLMTLPRTKFLYLAVIFVALAAVVAVIVLTPNEICLRFEMPRYERAFGFKLGEMEAPGAGASSDRVLAVTTVEPNGVFARSGVRPGDVPRGHHGIAEFCGDLDAALGGRAVDLRLNNLVDARAGKDSVREIRLQTR